MSSTFSQIPNFVGVNAGQQFRNAVNSALGGVTPITPTIVGGSIVDTTIAGANISSAVAAATVTNAALRTMAARSSDRITFSDYQGADASGSTDNSSLIAQALADARAQKKCLYFPSGRWGYAHPSLIQQGDCVFGDGPTTQFVYIGDVDSSGDERVFATSTITQSIAEPESGAPTVFANFRVTGPWNGATVTTQIATPLIEIQGLWAVEFHDLVGEFSCNVGFMASFCQSVRFVNCRMEHCARDALNASGSNFIQAVLNQIHHCDDSAISAHANTGQAWAIVSNAIVAMNTIVDTPGIMMQGAKRAVIQGNVIERARQTGITVAFTDTNPQEGETPPIAVQIIGNVITDVIDRQNIDGVASECNYIAVGTLTPQAGSAASVPGDPNSSGAFVLPYPYFNVQKASGTDTTTPIPAAYHINVSGNICMRTIDPGTSGILYSSLGYGQMFTRNGWLDPTLDATALLQGIGVAIFSANNTAAEMRYLRISGNKIQGMVNAVSFSQGMRVLDADVSANECVDFSTTAFALPSPGLAMRVRFSNNLIDGDPFFRRRGSGAIDGGWASTVSVPCAIVPNGCTGVVYERNVHRNVSQVAAGGFTPDATVVENTLYCNPAGPGYNAANAGIGTIPNASIGYHHVIEDSNPTSVAFGTILNGATPFASAQPTTGVFVQGQFVWNQAPALSSGNITLGWMRLTTGSGNVTGTDWFAVTIT